MTFALTCGYQNIKMLIQFYLCQIQDYIKNKGVKQVINKSKGSLFSFQWLPLLQHTSSFLVQSKRTKPDPHYVDLEH